MKTHWTKTAYPCYCYDCTAWWWSFKKWVTCKFCEVIGVLEMVKMEIYKEATNPMIDESEDNYT
jgi:hypothetical protein